MASGEYTSDLMSADVTLDMSSKSVGRRETNLKLLATALSNAARNASASVGRAATATSSLASRRLPWAAHSQRLLDGDGASVSELSEGGDSMGSGAHTPTHGGRPLHSPRRPEAAAAASLSGVSAALPAPAPTPASALAATAEELLARHRHLTGLPPAAVDFTPPYASMLCDAAALCGVLDMQQLAAGPGTGQADAATARFRQHVAAWLRLTSLLWETHLDAMALLVLPFLRKRTSTPAAIDRAHDSIRHQLQQCQTALDALCNSNSSNITSDSGSGTNTSLVDAAEAQEHALRDARSAAATLSSKVCELAHEERQSVLTLIDAHFTAAEYEQLAAKLAAAWTSEEQEEGEGEGGAQTVAAAVSKPHGQALHMELKVCWLTQTYTAAAVSAALVETAESSDDNSSAKRQPAHAAETDQQELLTTDERLILTRLGLTDDSTQRQYATVWRSLWATHQLRLNPDTAVAGAAAEAAVAEAVEAAAAVAEETAAPRLQAANSRWCGCW